jgi:hypothetical protein
MQNLNIYYDIQLQNNISHKRTEKYHHKKEVNNSMKKSLCNLRTLFVSYTNLEKWNINFKIVKQSSLQKRVSQFTQKRFILLAHGPNAVKLFTPVIYECLL